VRLVEADALVKLPNDISTELAAAILAKGFTAWALLTTPSSTMLAPFSHSVIRALGAQL
jgi:NADPH:quinone reductase-like Zn-dependent oxidoreductase